MSSKCERIDQPAAVITYGSGHRRAGGFGQLAAAVASIDSMGERPPILKLVLLIGGSLLFSLAVVTIFFPLFRIVPTLLQTCLAFLFALCCNFLGREWFQVPLARRAVKTIIYAPLLAFLFAIVILFIPAQPLGWFAAHRDLSNGHIKVRIPIRPWHQELTATLKDRYGIDARPSGGCLTSIFESTFNSGYQSVVANAIKAKYGSDVVKKCADEAESSWEKVFEAKKNNFQAE